MGITNNAIMFSMSRQAADVIGGSATQQTRLTSMLSRTTKGTSSFILPSILSGEASEPMMLVNDGGSSVNVYPAANEKINGGSVNTPIAVGAGATLVLFPVLNSPLNYPSTLDWRGAVIS